MFNTTENTTQEQAQAPVNTTQAASNGGTEPTLQLDFSEDDLIDTGITASVQSSQTGTQNNPAQNVQTSANDYDDYSSEEETAQSGNSPQNSQQANTEQSNQNEDEYSSEAETLKNLTSQVLSNIAKKFGVEDAIENEEQLFDVIIGSKAERIFDNDKRAQHLTNLIEASAEDKVRYELTQNAAKYGMLSKNDIERKIAEYIDNNEIDTVAQELDEKHQAELTEIFNKIKADEVKKLGDLEKNAQDQVEAETKLRTAATTFIPEVLKDVSEKTLNAIRVDVIEYLFSGKYAEQTFIGVEVAKTNPEKLIETAMWNNPKIRNYILGRIEKRAIETGESQFIKKNLIGKGANIGANITGNVGTKGYVTDLNENDLI